MSVDTHERVHELLGEDLPILVIEEESAQGLQAMLIELSRHDFNDVVGVTATSAVIDPGIGPQIVQWRYIAVVRRQQQITAAKAAD